MVLSIEIITSVTNNIFILLILQLGSIITFIGITLGIAASSIFSLHPKFEAFYIGLDITLAIGIAAGLINLSRVGISSWWPLQTLLNLYLPIHFYSKVIIQVVW
ncbi:MAG: hypothetical protein H0X03_07695, partial [Nitrosopumilus sp.]|nr:hypothetical protein [Nitrosopumilus sp.]